jgi:serine phosphatase RsbU (regulator of sigma subunit)
MVAISLLDEDRQWHKANLGLDYRETPRGEAFCNRVVERSETVVIPDATQDAEFKHYSAVLDDPSIRFYAGQPLAAPDGHVVGTLCIIDTKPRELAPTELSLLRDLADWVEKELATDRELVHAAEVQRGLLPRSAPRLPGYEVAGRCRPARRVGGDFFDWYPVGEEHQFVLCDVMGKGVGAAIIGASVRAVVRGTSRFNDLGEAMKRTSVTLEQDLAEVSTFATVFCARVRPSTHQLRYVDAGHGLNAILTPGGGIRPLISDGLPIGATFGTPLSVHEDHLEPGEALIAVSDGFLDFFDDIPAAVHAVQRLYRSSGSVDELVRTLCDFAEPGLAADDLTVIAVRRVP